MAGSPAKRPRTKSRTIEAVNAYSRSKAKRSLEIINSIMEDVDAPIAVRMKAAEAILDRAVGKPTQKSEQQVEVSVQALHLHAVRDAADKRLQGLQQGIGAISYDEKGTTIDVISAPVEGEELV